MDSAETKMLWRVASWWRSTTWLSTNCFAQKERNSDAYNLNHHENHNFGILVTISWYNHFLQTWFHTPQSCENLCAPPGTFAVTRHAWFVWGIQVSFKITVPRVRWASALFFWLTRPLHFGFVNMMIIMYHHECDHHKCHYICNMPFMITFMMQNVSKCYNSHKLN